jgi:hypothetical protein
MLYNAANSTTLCATSISLNEHQLKGVDEREKKKKAANNSLHQLLLRHV